MIVDQRSLTRKKVWAGPAQLLTASSANVDDPAELPLAIRKALARVFMLRRVMTASGAADAVTTPSSAQQRQMQRRAQRLYGPLA